MANGKGLINPDIIEALTEATDDTIQGGWDNDTIYGLGGDDQLHGGPGKDKLFGGSGDDTLKGGGGADDLYGGSGVDTASYEAAVTGVFVDLATGKTSPHDGVTTARDAELDSLYDIENVTGSMHADILWGDDGANVLSGLDGNDNLKGYGGSDELSGGRGDDALSGMDGDDILNGDRGNDLIIGGAGRDTMFGNSGADHFTWTSAAEAGLTAALADVVGDFVAADGDRLDLSLIDADVYASGNQAFTFIGDAAFSGTPGEVRYYHADGNTYIEMQTGTSVDVEGVIVLAGLHTPEASWFVL